MSFRSNILGQKFTPAIPVPYYTYSESYSVQYKAVLDLAIGLGIPIPSPAERTRQNSKMEAFVNSGLLAKVDVLMEFKGYSEANEFRKICWKRLIMTAEPSPTPMIWDEDGGWGTHINNNAGADPGYVDLLWNQLANAVNFQSLNSTISFHSVYFNRTILGGRVTYDGNQIYFEDRGATAGMLTRILQQDYNYSHFDNATARTFIVTNKAGRHIVTVDAAIVSDVAQSSAGTNSRNVFAFAWNNNGTPYGGMSNMGTLAFSSGLTEAESVTMDSILRM